VGEERGYRALLLEGDSFGRQWAPMGVLTTLFYAKNRCAPPPKLLRDDNGMPDCDYIDSCCAKAWQRLDPKNVEKIMKSNWGNVSRVGYSQLSDFDDEWELQPHLVWLVTGESAHSRHAAASGT